MDLPVGVSTPNQISCLLIDDHPAMIDAVTRVLDGAGIRIVGAASSAIEGLEMLSRRPADVALVDLRLPDMDGIALAQAIARTPTPPRTILYSGHADPRIASQALAAGVNGLITKGSPLSEVVRAVQTVAAGGTYIDPLLGALALQQEDASLSTRDERLLEFISNGMTDERIGEELHLSAETVRANVRKVVRTLGARNRTHAVALALKTGVIQ
ncbi:MAG TPA: response regulator transcription factor [Gaiellaceae bacterium]|jgi:DNA-binding NarL/FixJ family response regulator|nr:response regulator transcription factor [Gaiellaceae bacterium]